MAHLPRYELRQRSWFEQAPIECNRLTIGPVTVPLARHRVLSLIHWLALHLGVGHPHLPRGALRR